MCRDVSLRRCVAASLCRCVAAVRRCVVASLRHSSASLRRCVVASLRRCASLCVAASFSPGWLRGCLPVVNRICSSLPPLFYAPKLKAAPRKKVLLGVATLAMAIPFCLLAVTWLRIWQPGSGLLVGMSGWMPALFLVCYGVVFVFTGLQRLAWSTLQGKLIRDNRRGRLLAISGLLGSIISVTAVLLLIPGWLKQPDGGFAWIFLMTAAGFVVAGGLAACASMAWNTVSWSSRLCQGCCSIASTSARFRITRRSVIFDLLPNSTMRQSGPGAPFRCHSGTTRQWRASDIGRYRARRRRRWRRETGSPIW